MRHPRRVFGALVLLLALSARAGHGAAAAPVAICTFVNPAYSGSCVVREAIPDGKSAAAVCGAVLKCLNSAACSGKNYCNATEIRGGWALESAETETKTKSRSAMDPADP
jgi:hypothetical protein